MTLRLPNLQPPCSRCHRHGLQMETGSGWRDLLQTNNEQARTAAHRRPGSARGRGSASFSVSTLDLHTLSRRAGQAADAGGWVSRETQLPAPAAGPASRACIRRAEKPGLVWGDSSCSLQKRASRRFSEYGTARPAGPGRTTSVTRGPTQGCVPSGSMTASRSCAASPVRPAHLAHTAPRTAPLTAGGRSLSAGLGSGWTCLAHASSSGPVTVGRRVPRTDRLTPRTRSQSLAVT